MNRAPDRREAILAAIKQSVRKRGFPPSQQELAERFGVSKVQIGFDLAALAEEGWIERLTGPGGRQAVRGIRVLTRAERAERRRRERSTERAG